MFSISDHGTAPTASVVLEKANLLGMTIEATEKDRSLKTRLLLSTNSQSPEKISGRQVWKKHGYFSDKKADFNIEKRNFPENTLCHINQGYLCTVKGGELTIYNHNFILGLLIVTANQPKDIETYVFEKNEVKLIVCLHGQVTREFLGFDKQLVYIILRGDDMECFFSYGCNEKKSKVLCSAAKDRIPNAIISTCFKKHFHEIMNDTMRNFLG